MVQLRPLDPNVSIFQQIQSDLSPVVLVNIFQVAEGERPAFLNAWEKDANWMKQQPGFISTQMHRGIAGSTRVILPAQAAGLRRFSLGQRRFVS
jgi:antibiotic biosynthesis monooxygenase (ABM) superfamily enzyme